jgi:hypothetical protein
MVAVTKNKKGDEIFERQKIKISSTFSVFSNSGHVDWMSGLPDTILKGGYRKD